MTIGVLIVVAGIVAAAVYLSNQKSGQWSTGTGLEISGFAVPTSIDVSTQTDIAGSVANGLTRGMTSIVVVWNITRTGLVAADLEIAMAFNHTTWIAITPTSCGADCLAFAGPAFDLPAGGFAAFDLRITVHASGVYTWTLRASGNA